MDARERLIETLRNTDSEVIDALAVELEQMGDHFGFEDVMSGAEQDKIEQGERLYGALVGVLFGEIRKRGEV